MSPTSVWNMSLRNAPTKCVKGPPFGMSLVEAFDAGKSERAAASALAVKVVVRKSSGIACSLSIGIKKKKAWKRSNQNAVLPQTWTASRHDLTE
jgi:hypothetical protein